MPRLRLKNGPAQGEVFPIGENPIAMGRDAACEIQILDKGASRRHAEVFRIGEMCFIRDLNSRNGIYVNDNKVDEELLREGDRIQIGATIAVFESVVEENQDGVEFSEHEVEDDLRKTISLRLEDLSAITVSSGDTDGSEALHLRALYALTRLLTEESDYDTLINKALDFCARQISATSAYLFTHDEASGSFIPSGSYLKAGTAKGKISRSIIRRCIQEGRAVLTTDAMQDSRFSNRESIVMKQIKSVICAPLSSQQEVNGVAYFSSDSTEENFTEDQLEFVAAMTQMLDLALSNIRTQREQRERLLSTIKALVFASEMHDPSSQGHSERIATYAVGIATQMHLPERQRNNIQLAALLHDVGKIVTDSSSFYGTGTEKSDASPGQKRIKATMDIISNITCAPEVIEAIRDQYEAHDGSGRNGKKGAEIPLGARILAVAHEFDHRANQVNDLRAEENIRRAIVE
ncbi:MAG: FHA domain-containing protein, partial [Planctomycetes bacterium]|nr:FHA domain-containing protein [Planctomycetota bacterium]